MLDVTHGDIMRLTNGLLTGPRHLFSDLPPSSLQSPSQQVERCENASQVLHFLIQIRR